jgi:hypothetical protein
MNSNRAGHYALPDARLIKDVFLAPPQRIPTLKKNWTWCPLAAAYLRDCPPDRFRGTHDRDIYTMRHNDRVRMRMATTGTTKITPRLLVEVHGMASTLAYCHQDRFEKSFGPIASGSVGLTMRERCPRGIHSLPDSHNAARMRPDHCLQSR